MIAPLLKGPHSYGTTWSLRHPVESRCDVIGLTPVMIYANTPELPGKVMRRLQTAFQRNTYFNLVDAAGREIERAEQDRIPMMILWGKAELRL